MTWMKTPDSIIFDAVSDWWQDRHDEQITPDKVRDAFISLWHMAIVQGQTDCIDNFVDELGEFDFDWGESYVYGDHPDTGGGIFCRDLNGVTFLPFAINRADVHRILGPNAMDMIEEYGVQRAIA